MTIDDLAKAMNRRYGQQSALLATDIDSKLDVIPTGILALDYELGTGGWPYGKLIELYGPPGVGKSTLLGFSAIRNVQAAGHYCVYIALEPGFDPNWAEKNGVNLDKLLILQPDNGEDAFAMLKEAISATKLVIFDSLAAVFRESQMEIEGNVQTMGGASSLIASGMGTAAMKAHKNQTCVIFINQQRVDMKARVSGVFTSPGGEAVKHWSHIRVQFRFAGTPLRLPDESIYGREVKAVIKKNKCAEGENRVATFMYYTSPMNGNEIGIDKTGDVISTAMRTGIFQQSGSYYAHPLLPNQKVQGKEAVAEAIRANPQLLAEVREGVLKAMLLREQNVAAGKAS